MKLLIALLFARATAAYRPVHPPTSRRAVLRLAAAAAVTRIGAATGGAHALEDMTPPPPLQEPEAARKLLALVEGRRASQWAPEERAAVDALINEVVSLRSPWPREDLRGKWKLAYLQPGPGGAGVDRRIPFPEFDFNDSFQVFGVDSLTNVGELLGPALEVRVSGKLLELDPDVVTAPKRFRADIDRGRICLGTGGGVASDSWDSEAGLCVPLPIKGEGLFDGVYLGRRLRIGQNLNGGGARIVQVRVDA